MRVSKYGKALCGMLLPINLLNLLTQQRSDLFE